MAVRLLPVAKFLALWAATALIVAMTLSRLNLIEYWPLLHRGVMETGTVTALEPTNHQFVDYSYEVGGRVLSSTGSAGFGNPEFRFLRAGDRVSVWYLPDDPKVSCLGDPHLLIRNEVASVLLAAVGIPAIALGGFAARYPGFRRWLVR